VVLFAARMIEAVEIDPIVIFEGGAWLNPTGRGGEDEPVRWRDYYATGPHLRLLARNEVIAAGHAQPTPPAVCFDLLGRLVMEGPAPVDEEWVGLATSDLTTGGPVLGRAASEGERATLLEAARRVAGTGGVEDSLTARLAPFGPLLALADGGVSPSAMVGAFRVSSWRTTETRGEVDRIVAVLVILKPNGDIWFDWLSDETGDAVSAKSVVDVIDLTADGTPELVVRSLGYEGWSYDVWDVIDGEWSRIFSGGDGGC